MTWNAPTLADHGTHVSFACEDGSAHVLESKTGRLTKSLQSRLAEANHGIPGVVAFIDGGISSFRLLELWDVAQNRSIMRERVLNFAPLAMGPEGTFYVFYADVIPGMDVPMTRPRRSIRDQAAPPRRLGRALGPGQRLPQWHERKIRAVWRRSAATGSCSPATTPSAAGASSSI